MAYQSLRRTSAASYPVAAVAAATGDLVRIFVGSVAVAVHRSGADVVFELSVAAEAPIELHAHGTSLIVIPIRVVALETAAHVPEFIGSVELACTGERGFDVVIEGEFHNHGDRAAHLVPTEDILQGLLDVFSDRIEQYVASSSATMGIPF